MLRFARARWSDVARDRESMLPAQRSDTPSKQNHYSVSAGINHAGSFQDRQQFGAATNRLFSRNHGHLKQIGNPRVLLIGSCIGRHRIELS